ncbi:hypothetical protein Tco_0603011 [Tanacetum coccineum]
MEFLLRCQLMLIRALHKREYDTRVNERQIQTTEGKIDTGKALDACLVNIESIRTESKEQDTSSRSGNDATCLICRSAVAKPHHMIALAHLDAPVLRTSKYGESNAYALENPNTLCQGGSSNGTSLIIDSLPYALCHNYKDIYYSIEIQESRRRLKKLRDKDFATLIFKFILQDIKSISGRLLASFQDDGPKYEHVGLDTRSQSVAKTTRQNKERFKIWDIKMK